MRDEGLHVKHTSELLNSSTPELQYSSTPELLKRTNKIK